MKLFITKMNHTYKDIAHWMSQSHRQLKKPERLTYRFSKDKWMHRIGDLLIQYSIEHTHGLMPSQWSYDIQPNGHVKIASPIDIYVNLSYSFPYIICAIDHLPIGADIEEIKGMDDLNIAKQFSTNEFNQIQTLEDFYTIWTKKESYSKMIGEGLIRGLAYYDVTKPLYYQHHTIKFKQHLIDNCIIQLCHISSNHPFEIVDVPLKQLF
ncbi:4'-phosphopantetheinyl transferase superfamily protein [Staphylococcus lugdunensis]|uniref:4'-phosphopantetheinyl transferase family protein n=1 Tax=Staphylococcus lugdunensis TaxID=28035 RepID=A0A133QC25_STALU|nr:MULTISPECIES: 4'-phosphopantetheinyl transferase superfamily protein [Staphylococcus]EHS05199.1 4'-phosphopantetheinyl transferase family protein [Staphylococcus lugdunensis VCU139]AMG61698.1 4'-phosphopantetheinyl transferase [Staphylococcus lugdunensis]ARJ10212.1 4'-phosphopantetheinyl transferase [Staphylococcus lugdunensis]ARJ12760.1 4'-phosphopantetheinyl transferase [Staphylococcus lugdunensis]AST61320.1 4'-phosphopantetheinyl transferase [Staphylococcus lugdunensis]